MLEIIAFVTVLSLSTLVFFLYKLMNSSLLSSIKNISDIEIELKEKGKQTTTIKLVELIRQCKNLPDFLHKVSGTPFLSPCKYGSCQYSGIVATIETMKILQEKGVDPLKFFGVSDLRLKELAKKEKEVLRILSLQMSALTMDEGQTHHIPKPLKSLDDYFHQMKQSSYDLWTVARLAFQSTFQRDLESFVNVKQCQVPSNWLKQELFMESANNFRTGMECYVLKCFGYMKNMDEALVDFT
ncbi:hypothetical protein ABK040_014877 [Willaertia magna]